MLGWLGRKIKTMTWFFIGLSAAIAAAWTVFAYSFSTLREAQKPYFAKQLELCFEASRVAANIATTRSTDTFEEARERFWSLYYGELRLIEGNPVSTAMINFGSILSEWEATHPSYRDQKATPHAATQGASLKTASLRIADECRCEIANRWMIGLSPLNQLSSEAECKYHRLYERL